MDSIFIRRTCVWCAASAATWCPSIVRWPAVTGATMSRPIPLGPPRCKLWTPTNARSRCRWTDQRSSTTVSLQCSTRPPNFTSKASPSTSPKCISTRRENELHCRCTRSKNNGTGSRKSNNICRQSPNSFTTPLSNNESNSLHPTIP